MITKALIAIITAPFKAALSLLPEISPPDVDGLVGSMAPVWQFFGWADNFLPLSDAVVIFGLLVVAFNAVFAIRGVLWVLTKAHILGGD